MANAWNPGCPCRGCRVGADGFNRDDNSDINVGAPFTWTDIIGTSSIASNQLVLGASSVVESSLTPADEFASASVEVIAVGSGARLVFFYGGSAFTADYDGTDVSLGDDSGVIASTPFTGELPATLSLCVGNGRAKAQLGEDEAGTIIETPSGSPVIRISAPGGGTFDNFAVYNGYSPERLNCPTCNITLDCGPCAAGTVPLAYQLDIEAGTFIPSGLFHCADCDEYHGAFQLDWNPAPQLQSSGAQCAWTSPVLTGCFSQFWSGDTPVGPPQELSFFFQYEIGIARVLWLLQPDPPFNPIWHYEWHPNTGQTINNNCLFEDFEFAYHGTHGGITGCALNAMKILKLSAL